MTFSTGPPDAGLPQEGGFDRLAFVIATAGGTGLLAVAPGTFGAAVAIIIYLPIYWLALRSSPAAPEHLILIVSLAFATLVIGTWAAGRVCRICGAHDPGQIVIDEVCGQFFALIPLALGLNGWRLVISFLLFRLFDILKPYPIRKLEQLPSGFGVMADDVLAGIYTAAILWGGIIIGLI